MFKLFSLLFEIFYSPSAIIFLRINGTNGIARKDYALQGQRFVIHRKRVATVNQLTLPLSS